MGKKGAAKDDDKKGKDKKGVCPHAPMAWKSHFPSPLIKCIRTASDKDCLCADLRSIIWGVGAMGYPVAWCRGAL